MSDALIAPLARYLKEKLNAPDLTVTSIARIPGGASRETYRFRARYQEGGREIDRGLILRRDPPSSLIQTERSVEYRAYAAFHKLGIAVPKPVVLELDAAPLERPFFIMEEIEDCTTGSIMSGDPYGPHREKIGRQFFEYMGRIAGADVRAIGLADFDGARKPADAWKHEIARWEAEIDEDEREPQPIARAAIRWMKRNPPPPAQKLSVVHGDYRSGNFLFDSDGTIRGILDWEMAHLGDPLEDLAWALDPLWSNGDTERPANTIPRAEGIAIWEKASGLKADPKALFWWEIFASFKGLAIWISAGREYVDGRNPDPINAFSAWYPYTFHNRLLAHRLAEVS
jgi:aminoglycoside phosphotransferase (APT) family kinase protein